MSKQTVTVFQGDDPTMTFKVTDQNIDGSRSAYDFTDATILFLIFSRGTDEAPLSTTVGSIVGSASDGIVEVQLNSTQTATAGTFWYRLSSIVSGDTTTVGFGPLVIRKT